MNLSSTVRDGISTIRLQGRFDFDVHRAFREAFKAALAANDVREVEIDLSGVTYMDSSALGMLLLSRENASALGKAVALARPTDAVRSILDVANFQKLFAIR